MTPELGVVLAIIAVGAVVVIVGAMRDRRRHERQLRDLTAPPAGGVHLDTAPEYLQESEVLASAVESLDADAAERAHLAVRGTPADLPTGAPDGGFLNHPAEGAAVLLEPSVLIVDGVADDLQGVLNVLSEAGRRGRPLVWLAPDFSDRTLDTLRANSLTGRLRSLPLVLADAGLRRRAATLTGAAVVPASDVLAGYLPAAAWGTCAAWVADLDDSWVIPAD